MTGQLQNILDFYLVNDLDISQINEVTFKLSEEKVHDVPALIYLRQQKELELFIELQEPEMLQLKKRPFKNIGFNVNIVKPKSLIIPLLQTKTSELLLEISRKVEEVFSLLMFNESQTEKTAVQSEFEMINEKLLFSSFSPENHSIYLNKELYSSIFQPPDIWLADFIIQVKNHPLIYKLDLSVYAENKETNELILFRELQDLDSDLEFKQVLIELDLIFHDSISIKEDFFECFCEVDKEWFDFTLKKTQSTGRSSIFQMSSKHGEDVIEYEEESTSSFLSNAVLKVNRTFSLKLPVD